MRRLFFSASVARPPVQQLEATTAPVVVPVRFHPTVLYIAGSSRHLITEAIRGEGAFLRDRDGHRFMPDYHPDAELAPRDDVSRAIVAQMARTQHPNVYLDLSHLDPAFINERFPESPRSARGSTSTSPETRSPSAPAPITWSAA